MVDIKKPSGISTWLISDPHLGHDRIMKYEDRPFSSLDEMDEIFIKNWNSVVGKFDHGIILGDFSFYGKDKTTQIISRLKGVKILVLGNHDRRKSYSWWLRVGFNRVYDHPIIWNRKLILSHEPIWDTNYLNIHGHLHSHGSKYDGYTHFNVSVERINYTPILLEDAIKRMSEGGQMLDGR